MSSKTTAFLFLCWSHVDIWEVLAQQWQVHRPNVGLGAEPLLTNVVCVVKYKELLLTIKIRVD